MPPSTVAKSRQNSTGFKITLPKAPPASKPPASKPPAKPLAKPSGPTLRALPRLDLAAAPDSCAPCQRQTRQNARERATESPKSDRRVRVLPRGSGRLQAIPSALPSPVTEVTHTTVETVRSDDVLQATVSARVRGATLVAIPAIAPMAQVWLIDDDSDPDKQPWGGILCLENHITGDGRVIDPGAFHWDDMLPLVLRWAPKDSGGHDGAEDIGTIETIMRGEAWENGEIPIEAFGYLDKHNAMAAEAIRRIRGGWLKGVSVDLDDITFEVRLRSELVEELEALEGADIEDIDDSDDEDRDGMATAKAKAEASVGTKSQPSGRALVASSTPVPAIPLEPPRAWFADPKLTEPTPLHVSDSGRIWGHVAAWDTCHIGLSTAWECVTPPHSATDYAYFHTGSLKTAEGNILPVGHITLETRHALQKEGMTIARVMSHYENTGLVIADVAVGEDAHGIWIAGACRPGTTAEQIRELRAAPLSGDWREVGGNLELIHALGCNVPGFPIPRPSGRVSDGMLRSLIASGMLLNAENRSTKNRSTVNRSTVNRSAKNRSADAENRSANSENRSTVVSIPTAKEFRARAFGASMGIKRAEFRKLQCRV